MPHMPATTGSSSIDISRGVASLRDHSAAGDGTIDDTQAFQDALDTGKRVIGRAGDTYLVDGGLLCSTADQVIDMTGCTVKLKNNASSKIMLRLDGARSRVVGGEWDLNVANNTGGDTYGYQAVFLAADYSVAESLYVHDSHGLGIKGRANVNYAEVRNCRIERCAVQGVFFDGPTTADAFGARVSGCTITVATVSSRAIYISSNEPFTYQHKRWIVEGNTIIGPSSASTAVGITGRGTDGVVVDNQVVNFDIGISLDRQTAIRCVVAGNRVENDYAGYGGIEVNGGESVISGNYVRGHRYGIVGSTNLGAGASMDGRLIVGNRLEAQTTYAIYAVPASGDTARRQSIIGNLITATTALGGMIRLARDCKYSLVEGNTIKGPDSTAGRGVYLDSVNGNVAIRGNRFAGLQRAVTLYNNTATAYDQISFEGNDCSEDIGATDSSWLNLEGTATYGSGVRIRGNFTGESTVATRDVVDCAGNIRDVRASTYSTPEGNLSAGAGSTYVRKQDGKTWVKASGSGNTGWRPIYYVPRTAPTYGVNVSIATLAAGGEFAITPTDANAFQIDNPTSPVTGARITIRVINTTAGALGAVTWGTAYKLAAWTSPAAGFSRAIDFQYDGANWIEVSRTTADVPN